MSILFLEIVSIWLLLISFIKNIGNWKKNVFSTFVFCFLAYLFLDNISKHKDLTVFSKGKQTRSYCHIFDAVVMMINIIFKGKKFVYNVGNPSEEVSAATLAKKILQITENKLIKINKIPYPGNYPSDEPQRRCPSIKNYTSEFKFKPILNLSKGLEYFNKYAKSNFK